MPSFEKYSLAAAGTTGNNTSASVLIGNGWDEACIQFVVEAVGATPTVTWKVQGSIDNTNWFDMGYVTDSSDSFSNSTRTATAAGVQVNFTVRPYKYVRLVTTLNTNVTYRGEIYLV